ncbi:MAG: GNAT family N-acetyltransferase [Candidatus Odinarchaeota archaeon]
MDLRITPWDEVNPEEIAQFIFHVRQQEGLLTENSTIENYISAVDWWKERLHSAPIIAYSKKRIVGWLVIFSFVPRISTIGRWHPIIEEGPQKEEIAKQLLKTAITHAKQTNFERLEAELTHITPKNESRYEQYKTWYETQGFYLASEESRLELDLIQEPLPEPIFPPGFQLVPLTEFTNDELVTPFFEMFDNSKDRFWLDQTPDQRLECYKFWFNRDRPFVEEATGVLVKGDKIVGLTVVRPVQEVGMLGPIAILPKYRRRGLGRSLMHFSFHGVLKSGFPKIQLEFDITNEPAFQLYTELGFKQVHRLVLFALALI